MSKSTKIANTVLTAVLTILSLAWIYPVLMIFFNSLKKESAITTSSAFQLPNGDTFAGLENYINAIDSKGFLAAFGYTLLITVTSVALILIFCSMCAWFITRVNTWWSKACYYLFIFSMVVPFQMLMFTLSATADKIGSSLTLGNLADALGITVSKSAAEISLLPVNTPFAICIIYLGFGAGLAVFMFCGFMKSIPLEIEEAAMIDGCGPAGVLCHVIVPMAKPGIVTVCMISAMSAWNEYPVALVMLTDAAKQTLPVGIANLYEVQRYATDWGALFAALVLALIPTVVLFLIGQKQLLQGMNVGGIKG